MITVHFKTPCVFFASYAPQAVGKIQHLPTHEHTSKDWQVSLARLIPRPTRALICLHDILTQIEQVTSNSTNLLQFQHIHLRKRQCMYPALRWWKLWDNFIKIKVPEDEGTLTSGWSVSVLFGWVIVIYTLRLWEALKMKRPGEWANKKYKFNEIVRFSTWIFPFSKGI